jgi:hypothetical protein
MAWRRNGWNGSGKVVSMTGGTGAVPPALAQIEAYWQSLRPAPDQLPRRADFDPRGVADLLHATMLLERIASGQVRIRLAGMSLCDLMGMDLRGMPLSALMTSESREGLAARLAQVFDGPAIAHLSLSGEKGLLRPAFEGELLILPMCGLSGAVDRALACLVTKGSPGRAPRRFDLVRATCRPVPGMVGAAQRAPATPKPAAVPGMAEAAAPFAPAPKGTRPHLRLIKGGA